MTPDAIRWNVGQLRTAWGWIADSTMPGRRRPVHRDLSAAARANLNRLAAAERADRHATLRSGAIPTGTTPAPTNVAALDARTAIIEELTDLCWHASSATRQTFWYSFRPYGRSDAQRALVCLDYLTATAGTLPDTDVADIDSRLSSLVGYAHTHAGDRPPRTRISGECPACGRRSLEADVASPDYREWTILCVRRACRCDGRECACGLPQRHPGMGHIWGERLWDHLGQQLADKEAA